MVRAAGAKNISRIPSLDGLRFIAAFSVMLAHGYWFIVQLQDPTRPWSLIGQAVRSVEPFGMTLFFVLSGFVIHFNYHRTVGLGRSGNLDFLIARFARLYPLFIVVFGLTFLHLMWAQGFFEGNFYYFPGNHNADTELFFPLPFYLSFTLTWLYLPVGPDTLAGGFQSPFGMPTSVMWSLSTEWFFYLAYIALGILIARLKGAKLFVAIGAVCVASLIYYVGGLTHEVAISAWAVERFGAVASLANGGKSFVHWMLFLAPYGRMTEFLLGALAAQLYLARADEPLGERQKSFGSWLTLGLVTLWLVAQWCLIKDIFSLAVGTSCYAVLVAAIIYAAARYDTIFARLLSGRIMVKCGEASYSQYLLHVVILHTWGVPLAYQFPHQRVPVLIVFMLITLLVSRASYRVFERPAQRWIRRNFRPMRFEILVPALLGTIACFSVLCSIEGTAVGRGAATRQPGTIHLLSASLGDNCGPGRHDNVLPLFRQVCNGRESCAFTYSLHKFSDPAGGCDKRMTIGYDCGVPAETHLYVIDHFDREEMPLALSCRAPGQSTNASSAPTADE